MAYSQAQFIGHCIYTAPNHIWDDATKMWKDQYNGLPVPAEDIKSRIAFAKVALELAYQKADSARPEVLKILMFPECFFQGAQGAYPITDVASAVEQLQALVRGEKWRDWIVVFGTINASYEDGPVKEIATLALVQKGGYLDPKLAHDNSAIIRKALFCLDLLDAAHLKGTGLSAEQAGFGTTVNEGRLVGFLRHVLAPDQQDQMKDVFEGGAGQIGGWPKLKARTEAALNKMGDAVVVRSIRDAPMPTDLTWRKDWLPVAKKLIIAMGQLKQVSAMAARGSRTKFAEIVSAVIEKANKDKVEKVLSAVEFPMSRWDEMLGLLTAAASDDGLLTSIFESEPSVEPIKNQVWDQDWIGATKKMLDLYLTKYAPVVIYAGKSPSQIEAADRETLLLPQKKEGFFANDYRFSFDSVKGPTDNKLTFGLEICADHGAGRLRSAQGKATKEKSIAEVDIQLVASAGMCISDQSIAVRDARYIFNCDGWNIPTSYAGGFNGVADEVIFKNTSGAEEKFKPHTELRKANSPDKFVPKSIPVDASLAKGIFPQGAGNLHVYGRVDI